MTWNQLAAALAVPASFLVLLWLAVKVIRAARKHRSRFIQLGLGAFIQEWLGNWFDSVNGSNDPWHPADGPAPGFTPDDAHSGHGHHLADGPGIDSGV